MKRTWMGLVAGVVVLLIAGCSKGDESQSKAGASKGDIRTVKGKALTVSTKNLSRAALAATLVKPLAFTAIPKFWPAGEAWRPHRNSGPFTSGSNLEQIQIVLSGDGGSWYYNNFFKSHPATSIYQRYYRIRWGAGTSFAGTALPADPTPVQKARRAVLPNSNGAHGILMSLYRIEYSSRFGGTVRLRFRMADYPTLHNQTHQEDFDIEFRQGEYYFDLKDLEMSVYVNPLPGNFNPVTILNTSSNAYAGAHQAEFEYSAVAAYKLVDNSFAAVPVDDAVRGALQQVLTTVGNSAARMAYFNVAHAQRFVLGFMHDQFQTLFNALGDPADGVESVWLSDNFADVTTKTRTPVFILDFELTDVGATDDDYELWALNWHLYKSPSSDELIEVPIYPSRYGVGWAIVYKGIKPGGSTPRFRMGTWNLSHCASLAADRIQVRLYDPGFFSDKSYGYGIYEYAFDCTKLTELAQSGEWGVVEEITETSFLPEMNGGSGYNAIIPVASRARVTLTAR